MSELPARIVLYDGVCGLCNAAVKFLIKHDRGAFHYAPLQGDTALVLKQQHTGIPAELASVVFIDDGRVFLRSKALLHAAKYMTWPWRMGSWLRWLPAWLLDPAYNFIARIRYRVWGQYDACRLPDVRERARLLP